MKIRRDIEIIHVAYECDGCGKLFKVESDKYKDRPSGYYLKVSQTTDGRVFQETNDLFFDSKECMMKALQFSLSSRMHRTPNPQ